MNKESRLLLTDLVSECQKKIENGSYVTNDLTIWMTGIYVELLEGVVTDLSQRLAACNYAQEISLMKELTKEEKTTMINAQLTEELRKGLI